MLHWGILAPTIFFLLPNQVIKMGKVIASDGSYVTLYDFLSAGFFVGWLQQDSNPQPLSSKTNTQP